MSGRLRFEAWTLPTATEFRRKGISIPALPGAEGRVELSGWSDCVLPVPDSWVGLADLMTDGSLIGVFDGDTWVDDFIAERAPRDLRQPGRVVISGPQVAGLTSKIAVYPPDFGINNPSKRPNWVWAGENALPPLGLGDLGSIREVWELYLEGDRYEIDLSAATGGTFTLTVDGQTTDPLNHNAGEGTIRNALQALSTVTTVEVIRSQTGIVTVSFVTPRLLSTGMTADFTNITGSASLTKVATGFDTSTNPTFTLSVEWPNGTVHTTNELPYNASRAAIEGSPITGLGIEGLPNVNDVAISGDGIFGDRWVITFFNPPDPTGMGVSFPAGTAVLTKTTEGALDPSPITISKPVDQNIGDERFHGEYDVPALEVSVDPAHLDTGADWSLKVNATGRYGGSQIVFDVEPGATYGTVRIRVKPTVTGKYVLVIRDEFENLIAQTTPRDNLLTAGSFHTLQIDGVHIPAHVTRVIMRVAVTDDDPPTWATHYVNWQGALFQLGDPEANPGLIVKTLLEHAQTRGVGEWLDMSFDETVDSSGTPWPATYSYQADGFAMYLSDVLADMDDLGNPWSVTRLPAPAGQKTHVLNLWAGATTGEDRTDVVLFSGGPVVDGQVVDRLPGFTAALAWGADDLHLDDESAAAATFGRWERLFDAEQHANTGSLADFLATQFADDETNRDASALIIPGSATHIPFRHFTVGDTVTVSSPGRLAKQAKRVQAITWRSGDPVARYEVQASRVLAGDRALWKAVERLLDAPKKRRRHRTRQSGPSPTAIGGGGIPDVVIAAADTKFTESADLICDGVNDAAIISQAIARLSARGGWVHLLEGTYHIGSTITFPEASLKLTGAGAGSVLSATNVVNGATVLRVKDAASVVSVLDLGVWSGLTTRGHVIEDLTIHGNKASATVSAGLIRSQGGGVETTGSWATVRISRVLLRDSSSRGIAGLRDMGVWHLTNVTAARNNDDGFFWEEATVHATACRSVHNGGAGWRNARSLHHFLVGCTLANNTSHGIGNAGLLGANAPTVVVGCRIANNGGLGINAVHAGLERPIVAVGNWITGNTGKAINARPASIVHPNYVAGNGDDTVSPPDTQAPGVQTITFSEPGALTPGSGTQKFVAARGGEVLSVQLAVGQAATGGDVICDVNVAGLSLFADPGDRPTVPATLEIGDQVAPTQNAVFTAGDWFTVDVDQVGSTDPGEGLTVMIEVEWEPV